MRGAATGKPPMANADDLLNRTIDDVIALHPYVIHVLNTYGIDTCCGGNTRLEDAATAARVNPALLLTSIRKAAHT
jgi:Regulator of cell morphogenesis and NO signaling